MSNDLFQTAIVTLLVPACGVYATWKLMPAAARRTFAAALLRWPKLPAPIARRLQRTVAAASGCGCDGCDRAAPPAPASAGAKVIVIHRGG